MLKFIKYHPGFAYGVGDLAENLSEEHTKILLEGKYAIEASPEEKAKAEKEKEEAEIIAALKKESEASPEEKAEKATGKPQRGK